MTKVWTQSFEPGEYTEAKFLNDIAEHLDVYMAVMGCQSLAEQFPVTRLEVVSDYPPADYFQIGGMFVVSKNLKVVFDEFKVHAEFLPLRVLYHGSELGEGDFCFCNILDCVEGFDFTRGRYVFSTKPGFADRIRDIKKLVIDEKKVGQYCLFRLSKCSPNIVCVCDRLAARIEELKLTGMSFVEPEDWRFGI